MNFKCVQKVKKDANGCTSWYVELTLVYWYGCPSLSLLSFSQPNVSNDVYAASYLR